MKQLITLTLTLALSFTIVSAENLDGQDPSESATVTSELLRFAGNIHQFNSIFPQEKVYLQFDNTSYYSGEAIWFKAYVVNATTLQRAQSRVLYVDLISPTGVVLKQQKLKLVGGQADGVISLLDGATSQAREKRGVIGLPSGFYEVRAYTNYMLNFSQDAIFSRVFAVYELPKTDGEYYTEQPVIKLYKPEVADPRPKTESLSKINCSFYPEGGHLIMGKPCRVAFKVTDNTGFGVDAEGVLDDAGVRFSTVHDGMGSFVITPTNRRNTVTLTVGGRTHSFMLPQPEQKGVSLTVSKSGKDSISIGIDCSADIAGKTLGMALTCRGEIVDFCTIETGPDRTVTVRSMAGVPEGVCRINIFDTSGALYASRSVYNSSQSLRTPQLEVQSDKDNYAPFDKVNLMFNLKDGMGKPLRDRFCLSVRDVRGQSNALTDDLRTSMLLSSDLKGMIETPSWYFDTDAPERDTALDLLMLVQGWERYDWQTITGQKEFNEKFRIEKSLTFNGWIMNSSGKKPMEGVEVLAALMPTDKRLTETYNYKTDSSGYFGFDIGVDFYDKAKMSIDAHADRKSLIGPSARIKLDRSMTPDIRAYQPQELVFTGIDNSKRKNNVQKADDGLPTVIGEDTGLLLPDVDIEEDRMYIDYFTFTSFDVVKDVELELDKGDYSTDMLGYLIEKGYFVVLDDEAEIALINGFTPFFYLHDSHKCYTGGIYEHPSEIDTKDIRSIIAFDRPMYLSNILDQCPLLRNTPQYQSIMQDVLVGDSTGTRSLSERLLLIDVMMKEEHELSTRAEIFNINKRVTTIDGYSRPYEFYAPEYPNGPVLGDVDYRRTLYWNPNVITDSIGNAQVEFYNSSITRHFNISAAGMTSSGIPYILDKDW